MIYRQGNIDDLEQLRSLALKSWGQFQKELSPENWQKLFNSLNNVRTYSDLLERSYCLVCENENNTIMGMAFLVPSGNPTEIYDEKWSYIRFLTVDPEFSGKGIGRQLTEMCIERAKKNKEQTIALHTSEMMSKARHIYESFGFYIVREIEPRFEKRYWLYKFDLS
jgi:ribosomal protein S18 acetylase RimI-like enzyme